MIMKKFWYILPVLACMLVLASCEKKKVEIDPALLIGHWAAPSQSEQSTSPDDKLVFVFLNEPCEVDGVTYGRWGYQFDEGDDVSEEDVVGKDYHKDGWFGWVAGKGEIKFTHMTNVGKAKTPVTNAVSAFDGQTMTMTDAGITYTFKKIGNK